MIAAFDQTDANDDVRAVIVTGAGKAFCAGADLSGGAATHSISEKRARTARWSAKELATSARDGGGTRGAAHLSKA